MKSTINILFLGGAKRVSLGEHFIEWGKTNNYNINIFSYELSKEVPVSEIATIIIGLKWTNPELNNHLLEIIAQHKIHIIIPFVDPATILCSKLKLIVPVFIPVSDLRTCEIFFSKKETDTWCTNNKIPVPNIHSSQFPRIAKPDNGSASQGIEKIIDQEALDKFLHTHDQNNYIIQQFIDANEYTVDGYRDIYSHNINYLVSRIRLEVQGGEAIKAKTQRHPEIESLSRAIVEKSNLLGAFTLQFLEDKINGKIYFMEANPRFGGGVVTSIGAGINVAECVIQNFLKQSTPIFENWENNLLMIRRYKEIYIHADNN